MMRLDSNVAFVFSPPSLELSHAAYALWKLIQIVTGGERPAGPEFFEELARLFGGKRVGKLTIFFKEQRRGRGRKNGFHEFIEISYDDRTGLLVGHQHLQAERKL